ncbi:unnamed protein product, partial [Polarella glacialis]
MATLPAADKSCVDSIADSALARLEQFGATHLSAMIWAVAKSSHHQPAFFEASAIRLADTRLTASMGSQHVANVLWAFAVVSYQPEIVEPLTIRAEQLVFEFRPMELAAVIWASAGAGWSSDSAFLRSASLAATSAVSAFRLDELAGVAWALARLHMDGSVFSS